MPTCSHCGQELRADDTRCDSCGIPLPPHHANKRQRTFIAWFIALVIFCFVLMWWLPPNWTS